MAHKTNDATIAEIHRIRARMADKFGGNIVALLDDARKRQDASGRCVWRGPSGRREAPLPARHGEGKA